MFMCYFSATRFSFLAKNYYFIFWPNGFGGITNKLDNLNLTLYLATVMYIKHTLLDFHFISNNFPFNLTQSKAVY